MSDEEWPSGERLTALIWERNLIQPDPFRFELDIIWFFLKNQIDPIWFDPNSIWDQTTFNPIEIYQKSEKYNM
jgi:hypothetical protein